MLAKTILDEDIEDADMYLISSGYVLARCCATCKKQIAQKCVI